MEGGFCDDACLVRYKNDDGETFCMLEKKKLGEPDAAGILQRRPYYHHIMLVLKE